MEECVVWLDVVVLATYLWAYNFIYVLTEHDVTVIVDFHSGDACATAYGCDLTHDYVTINGDYRS